MTTISYELRYSMSQAHVAMARSLDFLASLQQVGNERAAQGVFHPPVPPVQKLAAQLVEDAIDLAATAETLRAACLDFKAKAAKSGTHRE